MGPYLATGRIFLWCGGEGEGGGREGEGLMWNRRGAPSGTTFGERWVDGERYGEGGPGTGLDVVGGGRAEGPCGEGGTHQVGAHMETGRIFCGGEGEG